MIDLLQGCDRERERERERELIRLLRRQPVWFGLEWDTPKNAHHKLSSRGVVVMFVPKSHPTPDLDTEGVCDVMVEKKRRQTPIPHYSSLANIPEHTLVM